MTTIEGTAVPHPAVPPPDDTPWTPLPGPPLRLALLNAVRTESATLDGAWWPRSRSLADELPALIVDLHHRGVRVTRIAYELESWEAAPRRLAADGRVVRLGWFQGLDPHLVRLTGGDDGHARLDVLVVPPSTSEAVANLAMAAASARGNHARATAVLAAVGARPDAGRPVSG